MSLLTEMLSDIRNEFQSAHFKLQEVASDKLVDQVDKLVTQLLVKLQKLDEELVAASQVQKDAVISWKLTSMFTFPGRAFQGSVVCKDLRSVVQKINNCVHDGMSSLNFFQNRMKDRLSSLLGIKFEKNVEDV